MRRLLLTLLLACNACATPTTWRAGYPLNGQVYLIDLNLTMKLESARERGQCSHPEMIFRVEGSECCNLNGFECCVEERPWGYDWLDCRFKKK